MRYLLAAALIAGAIGWAVLGDRHMQQVASATEVPRQLSQISR